MYRTQVIKKTWNK